MAGDEKFLLLIGIFNRIRMVMAEGFLDLVGEGDYYVGRKFYILLYCNTGIVGIWIMSRSPLRLGGVFGRS